MLIECVDRYDTLIRYQAILTSVDKHRHVKALFEVVLYLQRQSNVVRLMDVADLKFQWDQFSPQHVFESNGERFEMG